MSGGLSSGVKIISTSPAGPGWRVALLLGDRAEEFPVAFFAVIEECGETFGTAFFAVAGYEQGQLDCLHEWEVEDWEKALLGPGQRVEIDWRTPLGPGAQRMPVLRVENDYPHFDLPPDPDHPEEFDAFKSKFLSEIEKLFDLGMKASLARGEDPDKALRETLGKVVDEAGEKVFGPNGFFGENRKKGPKS